MAKGRQHYDEQMKKLDHLDRTTKRWMVESIINAIRRDKDVRPLVLCAFLQDHARIIKEIAQ